MLVRKTLPKPFEGAYQCKACGYTLPWRAKDREWFPHNWRTTCPHCTGEFRWSPR